MRKLIFYFAAIVLILTLGSTGLAQGLPSLTESSSAPPPTPPTPVAVPPTIISIPVSSPNVFSYTDPTCSFKFNYPSAWEPYDEIDDTGTCKAEIDLFEGDYIIAAFAVYVENYESSLASYAISVEEWMMDPQNMPEYYKIKEEAVTIGGLPAIKRFYTWNKIDQKDNSKIAIKAVDIYMLKDKKGYILEGQVVQDKFEQILPELEVMFNNFTLSGVTSEPTTSEPGLPPVTVTSETVSSSNAPSTIEEITFKFCPYCGAPLQPDYKFCPGCGKPIPAQRSVKAPKKIGARNGNQTNINYSENLIQTRGFSEENNQFNYPRGMNKSYSKPFKSYKPAFISRSFGSKLVRLFPEKRLFPWAVSKRIMLGNYANLFPGSLGRK
ncbi:zinc-ribbon domain-containing protein, partial [bacterium]|nr:zinc-ribbon domain-containing protein [bacterium]